MAAISLALVLALGVLEANPPRAGAVGGVAVGTPATGNGAAGAAPSMSPGLPGDGSGASPGSTAASPSSPPTSPTPPSSVTPGGGAGQSASAAAGLFPGGLLIADRGNDRLLIVDVHGRIRWRFPTAGSLPRGQSFSADDAFIAPDGRTIVANDENHQVVDRIDIATRRVIWQYGSYDQLGSRAGRLHTPDDAYPLANGDVVIADIRNCRILEIAADKRIVRQWGRSGRCLDRPPGSFDQPNGDTPLPDGGLLVTEITGSRIVRLDARGRVKFDVHVPVSYPSDAQLDVQGNIIVVDYASPGTILRVAPSGRVLWRYRFTRGIRRLDHPSLAMPLPNGWIALNDDRRDRVVVIDPRTDRIVWQYGHADIASRRAGFLSIPDGIDVVPAGTLVGLP